MNAPDSFDQAMASLEEWDRQCRAAHKEHVAEFRKVRAAIDEITGGNS